MHLLDDVGHVIVVGFVDFLSFFFQYLIVSYQSLLQAFLLLINDFVVSFLMLIKCLCFTHDIVLAGLVARRLSLILSLLLLTLHPKTGIRAVVCFVCFI